MTRATEKTRRRYARYLGALETNLGARVYVPPSITCTLLDLYGLPDPVVRVVRREQRALLLPGVRVTVIEPSVAVRSSGEPSE